VKQHIEYFSECYPVQSEPVKYPQLWPIVQAHDDLRNQRFQIVRTGRMSVSQ
jgi:hypothetical protein